MGTGNSAPLDLARLPAADRLLDVVGLFCPLPIIRTAAAMRRLQPGRVLEVLADLLIENAERDGTVPSRRTAD